MAKLLMISANIMDDPYPVYPLGAGIVANALKEKGHEVFFLDMLADARNADGVMRAIAEFNPDYIAISMRNVDNVSFNDPRSFITQYKELISGIKRTAAAVPVILGGTAFTIFPGKFMEYLGADYGITGPGEVSLPCLIDRLEEEKLREGHAGPVRAIIHGRADLSGNNDYYLCREERLAAFYLKQGGMLNIFTKRGCPHKCIYCSYPRLEGESYMFRDPEKVVDEIEFLKEKHAADFLFFTDSVFNDKDNRYLLIMEEMSRRGLTIPWTCYLRPSKFSSGEVELMKRTGLHSVEWGTDCSTDETLEGMNKDFYWSDVIDSNNLFASHGIPGSHFIIFGGPGETYETAERGINNLSLLENCVVFAGIGIRVFPGTGISALMKKQGLISGEDGLFENPLYYHSPGIETGKLDNILTGAFKGRRNRVYPWSGQADRNRFMHNSGIRGPLWDLLLKGKVLDKGKGKAR
jgi:radical SAM superfamily enzyme YgiQ (UPF0313 family)